MLKLWAIKFPRDNLPISNRAGVCAGCGLPLHLARTQLSRLHLLLLGASPRSAAPIINISPFWIFPSGTLARESFLFNAPTKAVCALDISR